MFVLSQNTGPITQRLHNFLMFAAVNLANNEKERGKFKTTWANGIFVTEYRVVGIGGIYGIKFAAFVESEDTKLALNVTFGMTGEERVPDVDLSEIAWEGLSTTSNNVRVSRTELLAARAVRPTTAIPN